MSNEAGNRRGDAASIRHWFKRQLADPQVVGLAALLLGGFALIYMTGDMLAPVLAGGVIAYLLEGLVGLLERRGVPRLGAVLLVFLVFIIFILVVMFWLMPLLSRQLTQLIQQLPQIFARGQDAILALPQRYPDLFSEEQVREMIMSVRNEVLGYAQQAVSLSLASVVGLFTVVIYLVLVPFMVFFFLKDKGAIVRWGKRYLPRRRRLAHQVWRDVDRQIGNYVRGKFFEIMIVWVVTYATFAILGVQFAMLQAVLIGLSVLIPYIGAAVATLPVAVIAYFQWGFGPDFVYLVAAYAVIQALDGNLLVPLLFSEVVNLHPIAIITAVLFFGGLWGFWGVFFAIPLATLVQAVLKAWPRDPGWQEPGAQPESADSQGQ